MSGFWQNRTSECQIKWCNDKSRSHREWRQHGGSHRIEDEPTTRHMGLSAQVGTIRDKADNHKGRRNTPEGEVKLTQGHQRHRNRKNHGRTNPTPQQTFLSE